MKKCPFKVGDKVRFKDSDYDIVYISDVPLPMKKGEVGVITAVSKENPGYVTIDHGKEIWHWTLFDLV